MAKSLSTAELIGQLLAQADSAGTQEEKQIFFEAAQKKASRLGIDMAVARAALEKSQEKEKPTHRQLKLGVPKQRALAWYCELAQAIAGANDLRCTMARNSTYINFYGMPSDIDVVEAIYSSCITAMVTGGDEYLRAGEYKKDVRPMDVKVREPNPDAGTWGWYRYDRYGYGTYIDGPAPKYIYKWIVVDKPVSGLTARQNFYKGFVAEIRERLWRAKREAKEEALADVRLREPEAEAGETSTELVLRSKGREISEYYETATAGRVSRGGWNGSKSPVNYGAASSAGRNHAKGVDLGGRKSITTGPTRIGS
jgi:hypothetical protein